MKQFYYWWDFLWEGKSLHKLQVESTDPKFRNRVFEFSDNASTAIEQAEKLIDDLKAGRVDGHKVNR